jgi:hypothetical protein
VKIELQIGKSDAGLTASLTIGHDTMSELMAFFAKRCRQVGPFCIEVESQSLLGKPIYQITHKDGDVICHGGSGDYPGFSNSGRLISLRDPNMDWHILNLQTWEIVGFIPETDPEGFVTKHVMWGSGDTWLNGSIDYLPEAAGQWRSGTGGGRQYQFVQLYRDDATSVYYFLDTINETVLGSIDFPSVVGGLGNQLHNPVMARLGSTPVICGGITGAWQHVTHAIDAAGNLTKLEPIVSTDPNRWSHEFYDDIGTLMTSNIQQNSRLESIDLQTADMSVVADQSTWVDAFGAGYYQNQHGDLTLVGDIAVGSIDRVGTEQTAIVVYDLTDSWNMRQVAPFGETYGSNGTGDFWAATRPTISGDGSRVAWHGTDGNRISVFLTEVA